MKTLFDPIRIGELSLPNRIIMAPLTRCRASEGRVPNAMMAEYYRQRANAGLILTEATSVAPMGVGYPNTPGIWSDAQVEGWKLITKAVHDAGGRIFMQLWHVGRISDPVYLDGQSPVAPSAIAAKGHVSLVRPEKAYEVPRALTLEEIPAVIEAYRKGAENAKQAGFDGVELHGANGYLLDQFLQSSSNQRTDEYGGSIENRARLMLAATDAAISVWGPGRVGMHLAPRGDAHDMGDSDPLATFTYVAKELGKRGIAFICTREHYNAPALTPTIKKAFGGVVIANEGLTKQSAQRLLDDGSADAVAFGKDFISNPDLPERLKADAPLNPWDKMTFYGSGPKGYTDYPAMA
ncbi:MAG: alkene reductase [Gammaproteobacteria bacterium]|nr:alkene reductase [Gammaproteobacteria bacterium]MDP2346948.1 alkene reductase [Gammaproteobacteria bacterium]